MRKYIALIGIIIILPLNIFAQESLKEVIETLPTSINYPYRLYKDFSSHDNNEHYGLYYIPANLIDDIDGYLYQDMSHLHARELSLYNDYQVQAYMKYKPIPSPNSPNLIKIRAIRADDFRLILISCNDNGDILDFIEIAECEFIESEQIYVIPKQFCLEYGKLTIYQLTPTRTAPWVYPMIKSTDVINAQRKDIVYTIDATTGKFVKSSQTEYYPQDYPISYWGANGTEIWNGTETKIGTITY